MQTVLALIERLGGQAAVDEAELRFITALCFFFLSFVLLRFIDKHAHLGKTADWLNEILRSSSGDVGALQVNTIQRAIDEVRDFIDPSLARSLRGEAPSRWKKRWRRLKTSESAFGFEKSSSIFAKIGGAGFFEARLFSHGQFKDYLCLRLMLPVVPLQQDPSTDDYKCRCGANVNLLKD